MAGVRAGETRAGQAEVAADAPNSGSARQKGDGRVRGPGSQEAGNSRPDPRIARRIGRFRARVRPARRHQGSTRPPIAVRAAPPGQAANHRRLDRSRKLGPAARPCSSARATANCSGRCMELKRSGFNDDDIRAHENELRQNSAVSTAKALKEHFILERIAEDEKIEAAEADFDEEIALIAGQSGESPRRMPAQIEKSGNWDVLQNQIIERKVIDLILENATFKEVPFEFEHAQVEAVDQALSGEQGDIPDAKPESHEPPRGTFPEEKGHKRF